MNPRILRLGHSPDPDDAFMWWPLADFKGPDGRHYTPRIPTGGYAFVHVLEDIQSLNVRSCRGDLEITALSFHQFSHVADKYVLTACGASMGDGYGPMIVAKPGRFKKTIDLKGARLAIPGQRTSAWLACRLWWAEAGLDPDQVETVAVAFDEIPVAVASGQVDAGLIIHEGQLTYQKDGLALVEDLGLWWKKKTGLPLPLGGNAIRRDLIEEAPAIAGVLLASIRHALTHRTEALAFAKLWGRGLDDPTADRFVGMYVNDYTLNLGSRGELAVERFLAEGAAAGVSPAIGPVRWVRP